MLVVDTENESASLYADKFEFDTIPLGPPFGSKRYEACIDAAVSGGYDVLIIDSITHQWDGEGGILRRKEELDQRPGSNSYTNWAKFTPEHTAFIESIKQAPIHIIATMRSKQDYILESNDKGKQTPRKVGMAPIQRDGFNYEFSLVFDVQMDHKAIVDKNRTGLFGDGLVDLANKKTAKAIREWLDAGTDSPATPPAERAAEITLEQGKPPVPPLTVRGKVAQISTTPKGTWFKVGDTLVLKDAVNGQNGPLGFSAGQEVELGVGPEEGTTKKFHTLLNVLCVVEDPMLITDADTKVSA